MNSSELRKLREKIFYESTDLTIRASRIKDDIYIHTYGWAVGKKTQEELNILQKEYDELSARIEQLNVLNQNTFNRHNK